MILSKNHDTKDYKTQSETHFQLHSKHNNYRSSSSVPLVAACLSRRSRLLKMVISHRQQMRSNLLFFGSCFGLTRGLNDLSGWEVEQRMRRGQEILPGGAASLSALYASGLVADFEFYRKPVEGSKNDKQRTCGWFWLEVWLLHFGLTEHFRADKLRWAWRESQ